MNLKKLPFVLSVILIGLFSSCKTNPSSKYLFLEGFTQGTTYHITYEDKQSISYSVEINRLFQEIDSSMSIYRKNSIISGVNSNNPAAVPDDYFLNVIYRSREISKETSGAFDITVGPLVNAWGFGYSDRMKINPKVVDSLLGFVGYELITAEHGLLIKADPRIQLDVNAIAKGYTVDLVSDLLESKGIENYMVEIGGEVRVKGYNPKGEFWRIGVDKPIDDPAASDRQLQAILNLTDIAMATSGNYRRFYVEDGMKYSHTIDPQTGYPVDHNLLSATVFTDSCMDADAYATAFMVMGLEKSIEFARKHPRIAGIYLIYYTKEGLRTFMTEELVDWLDVQD